MKAIQVIETRIHCDTCHHEFVGEPPEWHGQDCPECGAPDIISDEDMLIWTMAGALREALNKAAGEVPDDAPMATLRFGTAPFRK